jgi:hypothetical protein
MELRLYSLSSRVNMCVYIPTLRWNHLGSVDPLVQEFLELFWIFGIGEPSRHAQNCEFC